MERGERYQVFFQQRLVLSFSAEPGVLLSTASRPPGFDSPQHPFVSAQAHDASHEQRIGELLTRSSSVQDFVDLLQREGYEARSASAQLVAEPGGEAR